MLRFEDLHDTEFHFHGLMSFTNYLLMCSFCTGLFMQDLDIFAAKMQGERSTDADSTMSVRCIEIAEEAHKFLK